ncbi:hypothetical protein V8F06_000757 [Rhypophila decipiens]
MDLERKSIVTTVATFVCHCHLYYKAPTTILQRWWREGGRKRGEDDPRAKAEATSQLGNIMTAGDGRRKSTNFWDRRHIQSVAPLWFLPADSLARPSTTCPVETSTPSLPPFGRYCTSNEAGFMVLTQSHDTISCAFLFGESMFMFHRLMLITLHPRYGDRSKLIMAGALPDGKEAIRAFCCAPGSPILVSAFEYFPLGPYSFFLPPKLGGVHLDS